MRLPFPAFLGCVACLAWAVLVPSSPAAADEHPVATAKLACSPVPEPGRVRCEVEVRVPAGVVLKWADVVVTKTPPFASPLRARVGPTEATAREDTVWRWALALAAKERGTGEMAARVRIVACVGEACTPSELGVDAQVVVGE